MLWPMSISGRSGEILSERWGERPSAYLGITVPGYPNFFCMYGPGTNLAHGGSLIFHSECQMRYITECLELLITGGACVARTARGQGDRLARTQSRPRCASWYGHSPRSSTLSTRTASARCTSCRRGGSSTTGRGRDSPIPTTSSSDNRQSSRQPMFLANVAPSSDSVPSLCARLTYSCTITRKFIGLYASSS